MRMNKALVCFPLIAAVLLQSAAYGEEGTVPEASTEKAGEGHALRTGLAVSGGCVGGAVLGTVVPVFGNLVGCALGGIAGWWFGRDKNPVAAESQRASAL